MVSRMLHIVEDRLTSAEPLTEEEMAEKDALAEKGFPDWQRRHFQSFIKGVERYGRDALDKVALEIADKSEEEVREYAKVFFERYSEVESELDCSALGQLVLGANGRL